MDGKAKDDSAPYVGALLRLCWQQVRAHMFRAIHAQGFSDLPEAYFAAFSFPLPNGTRLTDLASQLRMSRQATNYLVGQLEALGYFERRQNPKNNRKLIYLTERGSRVAETILASLRQLQERWADEVGRDRFDVFMDVLQHFSEGQASLPRTAS